MWEQAQGVQQENVVSSVEKISFLLYKILKGCELTPHIQEEKKVDFVIYSGNHIGSDVWEETIRSVDLIEYQ